jgi:carboxylesterase
MHAGPIHRHGGKTGCLLIHGLTGTPWAFQELADALAGHGLSVHAPLLPGHGTRPDDLIGIPWKTWVDSVKDEIGRSRSVWDELFLIGLSVGGAIALYLSAECPVSGVVSLSAPVRFQRPWVRWLPYLKIIKRSWKKDHKPASPEAGYDRYPLAALAEMLLFLQEMEKKLPEIACPALIVHSKGDRTVPLENAERIFERIGSAKKELLLLQHPCHTVTKGDDMIQVQEAVLSFIRANRTCG